MELLLILASITAPSSVANVDVWEINTVHSQQTGNLQFTQVILWRWSRIQKNHRVSQWMMVREWSAVRHGLRHEVEWITPTGQHYRVSARSFRSPYPTYVDLEVQDRQFLSEQGRVPYFCDD